MSDETEQTINAFAKTSNENGMKIIFKTIEIMFITMGKTKHMKSTMKWVEEEISGKMIHF